MTTYRELLREHYIQKRKKNPSFSLRAFAKQLGLNPGGLSKLLNGKMDLSLARAMEITTKLGLNEETAETFLNLVQLSKAKTSASKEQILKKIEKIQGSPVHDLSVDQFKSISDWYPMAILRITAEPKMDRTIKGMAKTLGITSAEVSQSIDRLKRLELVEDDKKGGYLRATEDDVHMSFKTDHEAAKSYRLQLLDMIKANVENENRNTRAIATQVLVLDKTQVVLAQKLTDDYMNGLLALNKQSKNKEQIYQAFAGIFEIKGKNKE